MNVSLKQKISVVGIGSLSTLLILLMTEVMFAQFLTDMLIGNISNNAMLLIIITGLFLLTIIIAFIVGYFITQDIALKAVRNASIMSVLCLVFFIFVIANGSLFILYRNVYSKIYGFEIIWIFPQVLVYFSIYVLNDVFNLFILTILVYYIFFIIFLEKLYITKNIKVKVKVNKAKQININK